MNEFTNRPPTMAAELEVLIDYLDLVDEHFNMKGRGVQLDIQVLANWLSDHPEIDAEIYSMLEPE